MRTPGPGSIFRGTAIGLIILGTLSLANIDPARSDSASKAASSSGSLLPQQTPTSTTSPVIPHYLPISLRKPLPQQTPAATTSPATPFYLPITMHNPFPPIQLKAAWTADEGGNLIYAFHQGEALQYVVQIANNTANAKEVDLTWTQTGPSPTGPCGEVQVYNATESFEPGVGEYVFTGTLPDCFGVYTHTVQAAYLEETYSLSFQIAIPTSSQIVIGDQQGFDKCALPTVTQMQTWWTESPYYTVNLYIGGNSLACKDPKLLPGWIYQVTQQGWSFILTWVGPQAPCTSFKNQMSGEAAVARQQGQANAEAAAEAARKLGFFEDKVIYYDVEAYGSNPPGWCRDAVSSFIQGWVEEIKELGFSAGAYGAGCSSYVADWAGNASPPDDVWIAHWLTPFKYREDVSVWGAPCVPDALWADHQRLKQYTGGHLETWGDLTFTIDSNVLDGQVNAFQPATTAQNAAPEPLRAFSPAQIEPQIQAVRLLSPEQGWALRGRKVFMTQDGGASWQDITPDEGSAGEILGIDFLDMEEGWLVRRPAEGGGQGTLSVLHTSDGGETWKAAPLPVSAEEAASIVTAYPEFLDSQTGWIAVKLQSGSNFSLGRSFATLDGGQIWEERPLPLGEPVRFVDPSHGWIAGGPAGDRLLHTQDGGRTWVEVLLPLPESIDFETMFVGLPEFEDSLVGILPVTLGGGDVPRLALFETGDGGETWSLGTALDLNSSLSPTGALPFSLAEDGNWRAASPGAPHLYSATSGQPTLALPASGLSGSIVTLDFSASGYGWALVQEGTCSGTKLPAGEPAPAGSEPLSCEMQTRLMATGDGGVTWYDASPLE